MFSLGFIYWFHWEFTVWGREGDYFWKVLNWRNKIEQTISCQWEDNYFKYQQSCISHLAKKLEQLLCQFLVNFNWNCYSTLSRSPKSKVNFVKWTSCAKKENVYPRIVRLPPDKHWPCFLSYCSVLLRYSYELTSAFESWKHKPMSCTWN